MVDTPTLIVGAGPAGLAVAGRLRERGRPFEVIECSGRVGNAWHEHYDRLQLHTVKHLSHLPGLPFPESFPRYVPRELLADYYGRYAEHFDIRPRFGEEAVEIRPDGTRWRVHTASGTDFVCDQVVVATGVNRIPHRPRFRDEEQFVGAIEHSLVYRRPDPYQGQRVLVVGMGNTGAEIALDLCDAGVRVALSVRGPVNIVPRDVLGRPTQLTALLLSRLPERLGDRLGVLLRRLTVGDLSRYGIATPAIPPVQQLRLFGKTPVVDLGTVARIKSGRLPVFGEIERFHPHQVEFKGGLREPFDTVLLATGYRAGVETLFVEADGLLDRNGLPARVVGSGRFVGVFFVGFDNYKAGGILGTIVRESEQVVDHIVNTA